MKLYPILLAFFGLFLLAGCNKEDNEQKFSLRSKKSRLTGNWRMLRGEATVSAPGLSATYNFDGNSVDIGNYLKEKYTLSLTINKDGTFSFKDLYSTSMLEASGTWNFNSGVDKSKKKEEVIFTIDKIDKGVTYGDNFFNHLSATFTYRIIELTKDKMTISSSGKVFTVTNGQYLGLSTEYELVQ